MEVIELSGINVPRQRRNAATGGRAIWPKMRYDEVSAEQSNLVLQD